MKTPAFAARFPSDLALPCALRVRHGRDLRGHAGAGLPGDPLALPGLPGGGREALPYVFFGLLAGRWPTGCRAVG
ncbi:hypothetical protein NKH77_40415 [Streptomyces sp. M19]